MPRANRHHIPGQVWHITHHCHQREFLFKFTRDRKRWLQWLFEARKQRYGLTILNYMVTSNHIHLLVEDDETDAISKILQLVAGRTAQEFNQRKTRKGAFWEDRYHATAIESGEQLLRCLVYIDMNMVRAGTVGNESFVEQMKRELGFSAIGCKSMQDGNNHLLREPEAAYTVHFDPEKGTLSP